MSESSGEIDRKKILIEVIKTYMLNEQRCIFKRYEERSQEIIFNFPIVLCGSDLREMIYKIYKHWNGTLFIQDNEIRICIKSV